MVDYNAPLYQHPQETWDAKKCEKLCRRVAKDGLGTKYPFKGYIGDMIGHYHHGMIVRYNGGTTINGKWWQGEEWQLPSVPPEFEIITVPTWGYRIIKKPTDTQ